MLKMKIKNLWLKLLFAVLVVLVIGVVLIISYLGYLYYGGLKAGANLARKMINSEMKSALTEVFDKVELSGRPINVHQFIKSIIFTEKIFDFYGSIDVHPTKGTGSVILNYAVKKPLTVNDIDALIAAFEKKGYIKDSSDSHIRDGKFIHYVTMKKVGKIVPFATSGLRIRIAERPEFSIMIFVGSEISTPAGW